MQTIEGYILAAVAFVVVVGSGYLARRIITHMLRDWAEKTKTRIDDVILSTIHSSIILWSVIGGAYAASKIVDVPPALAYVIDRGLLALLILAVSWSIANLGAGVIRYYGGRVGAAVQATSLGQLLVRGLILGIGIVIILAELGIEITPLIASLGIGGLAIALALQDTLANFFSGFYISAEKSIRLGDFIMIEGVGEGVVVDIGWRATKIHTLQNTVIVIPNRKLAEAVVTNYDLPEPELSISTTIGVSYDEDPEKVEHILLDEATRAVKDLPGANPSFTPLIRFTPSEYSLNFTVIWRALSVRERGLLIHEMNKRLVKRLKSEGIEIPFPVRTVYLRQEAVTKGVVVPRRTGGRRLK